MKVDVYQTNKEGTYLFLPQGAPFSSVPEPVRDTVGPLFSLAKTWRRL
ncbi:MAG: hypothetical protein ACLQAH_01800 [Limisphaerales bacterium]